MRRVLSGRRLYAALIAAMGVASASTAFSQCGIHNVGKSKVSNVLTLATPDVRCLYVRDPDGPGQLPEELWIGGSFGYAGDQLAFGVVSWNGSHWRGCGSTRYARVTALTDWQGGLFAVSDYLEARPTLCYSAHWDGQSWQERCSPFNGQFEAVASYQNRIYTGYQAVTNWDGQRWQIMSPGPTGAFKMMKVIDNELYVGGHISFASAAGTNGVYVFNGTSWRSLNGWYASSRHVGAITKYQGDIVIGGSFGSNGTVPSSYAARWNGTSWDRLEGNLSGWIAALEVFQGRLYAGTGRTLSRWDDVNRQWETVTVPGIASPRVQALAIFNSKLVVAGGFPGGVRLFDGVNWSNLSEGPTTGEFKAQVELNGERYVGGRFTMSQFPGTFTFGKLQGTDIVPLGGQQLTGTITDLIIFDGSIYAGGDFVSSGNEPIRGFARWDGQQWRSIGGVWTGASGNVIVTDMLVVNNELIISGSFPATSQHGSNIAAFDGTHWRDLDGGAFGTVSALGMYRGRLIAAGNLAFTNRPELGDLVQFDGGQWRPLTSAPIDIGGGVSVVVEHAGDLYIGGTFTRINGVTASQLAKFDGSEWTMLPNFNTASVQEVKAICSAGNRLFVSKNDATVFWNGVTWTGLRGGWSSQSIARNADGVMFTMSTGASFATAPMITQYRPCCPGDYNSSESVDITDLTTFLNDWFAGSGLANANFDNAINIQDVFDFVNQWQVPCP